MLITLGSSKDVFFFNSAHQKRPRDTENLLTLFSKKSLFREMWLKRWNSDHVIALYEINPPQANDEISPQLFSN